MTVESYYRGQELINVINTLKASLKKIDAEEHDAKLGVVITIAVPKDKDVVNAVYNTMKTTLIAKQKEFENL